MKYRNANSILPEKLIEQIQEFVQGEYIYIPIKHKNITESVTDYKAELEKRDAHIYLRHLEGMGNHRLAEMYNLSESSIRRIIIKQRKGCAAMKDKVSEIISYWGMQNCEIKQIHNTTWLIEDKYVLKAYKNQQLLNRNLKVLRSLESTNIPVGKIVPANSAAEYVSSDDTFFFLSEKLSGNNIVHIGDDMAIALKMGEIIADLHMAFKKCEKADTFWENSLLYEMNSWVKNNFERSEWKYVGKDEHERIVSQLALVYDQLPVQLIHRDVHFGNFLFENGEFSGYIDFDLSQRNIRIFDLCYFLLELLSEEVKLEITEESWFKILKNTFMGYERKMKLSEVEKRAVPCMMECIELLFIAYFDGINDVCCAENALKIFEFVRKQEDRIFRSIL